MTNLTAQQLEAIRKRAEAATGNEWTDFDGDNWNAVVYEYDRLTESTCEIIAECRTHKDADFIANAREDVPALLAEIDLLKKSLEGLGKAVEIYSEMPLSEALELLIKITQEDSQ